MFSILSLTLTRSGCGVLMHSAGEEMVSRRPKRRDHRSRSLGQDTGLSIDPSSSLPISRFLCIHSPHPYLQPEPSSKNILTSDWVEPARLYSPPWGLHTFRTPIINSRLPYFRSVDSIRSVHTIRYQYLSSMFTKLSCLFLFPSSPP